MREAHRRAFWTVATQRNVWIGVRETNSLAEKHIGVPGHHPKPSDCKAKTSDNQSHPLAGLVVNPFVKSCHTAFLKLSGAQQKWLAFLKDGLVARGASSTSTPTDFYDPMVFPRHYKLETKGRYTGALVLMATHPNNKTGRDCFIHSDYDLMAIQPADTAGKMETARGFSPLSSPISGSRGGGFSGTPHAPGGFSNASVRNAAAVSMQASHEEIQRDLNSLIGIPMIQHGPEFDWTGGVGAAPSEYVIWFGPNHQVHVGMSSMPFTIREMIKNTAH